MSKLTLLHRIIWNMLPGQHVNMRKQLILAWTIDHDERLIAKSDHNTTLDHQKIDLLACKWNDFMHTQVKMHGVLQY